MTNIQNINNQIVKFVYFNSDNCIFKDKDIVKFFRKIDNDFLPPLSSKINIVDWSKKIIDKAVNILAYVEKNNNLEIIGVISFYCNDHLKFYSYIPFIGIIKEYRSKGIASILFNMCWEHLKEKDFKLVGIETWEGIKSFSIYKKIGFKEIDNTVVRENGLKTIYMEMYL